MTAEQQRRRIRRIRQIAQARGIIERRRRKEAKNVLRFEDLQTFIVVAFPVQGRLLIESIQKHTFAGARKHARRCVEELSSKGTVAGPYDVKLFWLSPIAGTGLILTNFTNRVR